MLVPQVDREEAKIGTVPDSQLALGNRKSIAAPSWPSSNMNFN